MRKKMSFGSPDVTHFGCNKQMVTAVSLHGTRERLKTVKTIPPPCKVKSSDQRIKQKCQKLIEEC